MFEIFYWHWIVFGLFLMAIEIFLPSFIFLWLGLAAICVGTLSGFIDVSLTMQLALWTIFSGMFVVLWFAFIKPLSIDKTKAGLSADAIINETGMVIQLPINGEKGQLRFSTPKLGNDEWLFNSEDTLALGDRVRVTAVLGNMLIVSKA